MSSDPLEGVKIPPNPPYEGGSRTLTILEKELKKFPNIKIFGNPDNRTNILSFAFENIHPFDLGELLNQEKICIRVGHHCAMPLVKKLDPRGVCRVSLTHYNNEKDVERFVSGLEKVLKILE
jgi:cysteine desulfurase/selenocysteine lyase